MGLPIFMSRFFFWRRSVTYGPSYIYESTADACVVLAVSQIVYHFDV
jgi:hypothetical protein